MAKQKDDERSYTRVYFLEFYSLKLKSRQQIKIPYHMYQIGCVAENVRHEEFADGFSRRVATRKPVSKAD